MMTSKTACRRRSKRFALPPTMNASVEFSYPAPGATPCAMPIKDVSAGGVAFVLRHELPGLDPPQPIREATIRVDGLVLHGDLLLMHVTPGNAAGAVCGALVYPAGDSNIVVLQEIVVRLQRLADQGAAVKARRR